MTNVNLGYCGGETVRYGCTGGIRLRLSRRAPWEPPAEIFTVTPEQAEIAAQVIDDVNASGNWPAPVATKVSEEAPFYEVELTISTDFSTLKNVYIVKNALKREKDALEQYTKDFYE